MCYNALSMEFDMRVTTSNPSYFEPNRYTFNQPKTLVYEGEPMPAPKWAATGSVALTTGNPNWPYRLIDPSVIISIDDQPAPAAKVVSGVRTVVVDGSKGQSYVVTIASSGKSCNCPGYSFRKNCRHLNLVCD